MPAWSYVAVKVTASMLVVLPVILLVELVAATFGGVSLPAATWVGLSALLWLTAVPFAALGVLVGFAVGTEAVFPVVTGLMFVLGYFGGLFNPVSHMPHVLQAAARILPNFHHLSLGIEVLDGHALAASHWPVLAGYILGLGALIVWRHRVEGGAWGRVGRRGDEAPVRPITDRRPIGPMRLRGPPRARHHGPPR